MSFAPFAAIWVLLVAAAIIALFAERSKLVVALSIVPVLVAIPLWYLFRPDAVAPSLSLAGRQWAIGDAAWQLTGVVLLLCLTAAIWAALSPDHPRPGFRAAVALGLAAAVLPAVWAADDRTRLLGLALFAAAWALSQLAARGSGSDTPPFDWRSGVLILATLFPVWAAYTVPGGRASLSVIAVVLLIAAGASATTAPGAGSAVSRGLPTVAAASVLLAALGAGSPSTLGVVAATAAGLLVLLWGLARAWDRPHVLTPALALSLGGVILVAAVWAGTDALLAATRLAVFAPALAGLASAGLSPAARADSISAPGDNSRRRLSPRLLAWLVAFLAVAGLPLTVGFSALAPVYESWSGATGWVLLLVMVILLALWLATLYQAGRSSMREGTSEGADWLRGLALIPPAIGLIAFNFAGLTGSWITWTVIVLTAVAGVLLGHFAPDVGAVGDLLREAVALPQPAVPVATRLRAAGRLAAGALADALAILEGDNGLIWLLGLLLLIIWIT